ncbi:MAG: S8/S53 family peptidase [Bacteroidia bacterium]
MLRWIGVVLLWAQKPSYLVYFTSKPDSLLQNPEKLLSPWSLERRLSMGIPVDEQDVPVDAFYVSELNEIGRVLSTSKWLNCAHWEGDSAKAASLTFVRSVWRIEPKPTKKDSRTSRGSTHGVSQKENLSTSPASLAQLQILGLDTYLQQGIQGQGIRMAVFDAGFPGVGSLRHFRHIFQEGRWVAGYDFVQRDSSVFEDDSHGTLVLSTIAALDSNYVGGASKIHLLLARTEYAPTETRQEEYNWSRAAEWADSIGVHIIQSSLGYSTFDDPSENYMYAQMNGQTAIVSRAARLAARKGILVVTSAGNEGLSPWHYITAPADADSILAVGAISFTGVIASFSSRGPSADGRIKPDVVAPGLGVYVVRPGGDIGQASGTSFASPLVSAMCAVLWSKYPTASMADIRKAVILSADRATQPDTVYGYGIPNAPRADSILQTFTFLRSEPGEYAIFPSPTQEKLTIWIRDTAFLNYEVRLYDMAGQLVLKAPYTSMTLRTYDISTLRPGFYIVRVQGDKRVYEKKILCL